MHSNQKPAGGELSAPESGKDEWSHWGGRLVPLFLGSCVLLILAGYWYNSQRRGEARAEAQQELGAIADLKLRQIHDWREERLSDARFFFRAQFAAADVRRFLASPDSEEARLVVTHWLNLLKSGERYSAVMVFDGQMQCRLAIPESATMPASSVRRLLEQAQQKGDVVMGELDQEGTNGFTHLDVLFPVFAKPDSTEGPPVGAIVLRLDPRHFLFPLVQSWPTPSRTAETVLVRRQGDEVLYLNELRHRHGAAQPLRLPLASADLTAAKFLRGETGTIEGVDYRGVPVVAEGRRLSGTSWVMIAKEDRDEIYAALRRQARGALVVLGALVLAGTQVGALLWRQRNARFLERELALEREHVEQHKAQELEIQRLNRLYVALSQVNQSVARAGSREELAREACRALVQFGRFQMACIVGFDQAAAKFVPFAQFGDETGYLTEMKVYAGDRPEERSPLGAALRESRSRVCNDLLEVAQSPPWCEAALRAGWRSVAAFPILGEPETRGALAVYSQQSGVFGTNEQSLLAQAAADIAFGLDALLKDQRRRQAEENLQLQATALEAAANAIVITGADGSIGWVNGAFTRLTGYGAGEAIGRNPRVLKSGLHPPAFYQEMWKTISEGRVWQGEVVNRRKDGTLYTEEMTITPVTDALGRTSHFIAIKQDVTGRKEAEEALHQAHDELELRVRQRTAQLQSSNEALERTIAEGERREQEIRRLNHELGLHLAQLEEANKELESFSYSVSHDLRAPLRSIDGFSSALLEDYADKLDDEGKDYLKSVRGASQHMGQLIDDLLGLSRVTRREVRRTPVDLTAMAQSVAGNLAATEPGRQAEFVIPPGLTVNADPNLLGIVLENLFANAWKFTSKKPRARIELGQIQRNGESAFFIRDNGAGFEMAYVAKLFGAFQRLHSGHEFPGTGIGLATVQRIIHRHGGRVWAEGKPGQGACFYFTLPAMPEA
jgi:PAS domain S-box-containing protein